NLISTFQPKEPSVRPIRWGIRSPKSMEELLAMEGGKLIPYLKEAELGHDLAGPSMEGLGDAVAGAAGQAPERFSKLSSQFLGVDPLIISGLLRGIEGSVRSKTPVDWDGLLALCRWVVDQPREIPGRKTRYSDLDPGWVWTRRQIASLII